MQNPLKTIVSLAQRTGDTLIVTDTEGQNPVAILPLNRYADLMSVEEAIQLPYEPEETLETMFDPLADLPPEFFVQNAEMAQNVEEDLSSVDDKQEGDERADDHEIVVERGEVVKAAPTSAKKEDSEDNPEEEQFYLEPVE